MTKDIYIQGPSYYMLSSYYEVEKMSPLGGLGTILWGKPDVFLYSKTYFSVPEN